MRSTLATLARYGIVTGGGSDAPVAHFSPFYGLHAAVTRRTLAGRALGGDEQLTREEALRVYTLGSASVSGEGDVKGSIEAGKFADLVVLDRDFLTIPDAYYETVWDRVAKMGWEIKEDHEKIKELGVLVDADDEGYLLQLFTKPLQDRPTLFFEIICRRGSQSFGKGNFKALFESLEIEQARRGNL